LTCMMFVEEGEGEEEEGGMKGRGEIEGDGEIEDDEGRGGDRGMEVDGGMEENREMEAAKMGYPIIYKYVLNKFNVNLPEEYFKTIWMISSHNKSKTPPHNLMACSTADAITICCEELMNCSKEELRWSIF